MSSACFWNLRLLLVLLRVGGAVKSSYNHLATFISDPSILQSVILCLAFASEVVEPSSRIRNVDEWVPRRVKVDEISAAPAGSGGLYVGMSLQSGEARVSEKKW